MSDTNLAQAPQGNEPAARTADGTLVNQASPTSPETTPSSTAPAASTTPPTSPKPAEPAKDGKSLAAATETKAAPAGAPEKYSDFKAPEGFEIDAERVAKALPVFKELGLSQDQAQRLVDIYSQVSTEASADAYKAYETLRNDWRDKILKDPTLGDGTGLRTEVKSTIGRAIDSLPADLARDFREAMDLTGAGDNPAFVRAFYNLAQRIGEGTSVRGGAPSPHGQTNPAAGPRSAAAALYPNLPSSAS